MRFELRGFACVEAESLRQAVATMTGRAEGRYEVATIAEDGVAGEWLSVVATWRVTYDPADLQFWVADGMIEVDQTPIVGRSYYEVRVEE